MVILLTPNNKEGIMPVVGDYYKRSDFGIEYPRTLDSKATVNGETYFFIIIGKDYDNEIIPGGIVVDTNKESEVVSPNTPANGMHIFVRTEPDDRFQYMGISDVIDPYDERRNLYRLR
jgi:hypothetical protein